MQEVAALFVDHGDGHEVFIGVFVDHEAAMRHAEKNIDESKPDIEWETEDWDEIGEIDGHVPGCCWFYIERTEVSE